MMNKDRRKNSMIKCERCRTLHLKCNPPNRDWSKGEKCESCERKGQPCGENTRSAGRRGRGSKAISIPQETNNDDEEVTSSSCTAVQLKEGRKNDPKDGTLKPIYITNGPISSHGASPPSWGLQQAPLSLSSAECRENSSFNWAKASRATESQSEGKVNEHEERERCNRLFVSLAELLTLIELCTSTIASVQPSGFEEVTRNVSQKLDRTSWYLAIKAEENLKRIVEYIEVTNQESKCQAYRTLDLISDFDKSVSCAEWIPAYQQRLLRKLIALHSSQGCWPEIFRLIRRLSRVTGTTLTQEEERLFTHSLKETSSRMRPILEEHSLLLHGKLTLQNTEPFPPIHQAISDANLNVVNSLCEHYDARAGDIIGRRALHIAAASGDRAITEAILQIDNNLAVRDNFHRTPLFYAAFNGKLDMVKMLKEKGAEIQDQDRFGQSVLCAAAASGDTGVVKYLLESGADINGGVTKDVTPLYKAAERNHYGVCDLLLRHGANAKEVVANRKTAFDIASEKGYSMTFSMIHQSASLQDLPFDSANVDMGAPNMRQSPKPNNVEEFLLFDHGWL